MLRPEIYLKPRQQLQVVWDIIQCECVLCVFKSCVDGVNVSKECYVEYAQKLSKHRRPVFPSQADIESRSTEAYKVKKLQLTQQLSIQVHTKRVAPDLSCSAISFANHQIIVEIQLTQQLWIQVYTQRVSLDLSCSARSTVITRPLYQFDGPRTIWT